MTEPIKNLATADDTELVAACRRGELAAFECLVERHQRRLLNLAFRLTGVYEDACDIVQDAFLAAWRKLGEFRGEALFSTWLTAIAVNLCRTRVQQQHKRARREAYSLDAPMPGSDCDRVRELPSGAPSVLEQLEEAELRRALRHCIDLLTPDFREVLVLREMQELSYEEVGGLLQLREGTVKSRLFRAREVVKDCLTRGGGGVR